MPMNLNMAVAAAASSFAVSEAFVAPSSMGLRGNTAQEAVAMPMADDKHASATSWGLSHFAASLGGVAMTAAGVMRASNLRARRSQSSTTAVVTRAASDSDSYLPGYKMSPAVPYCVYPEMCEGWVGGEKGFDPLRISDVMDMYTLREMELKHGRVCMLAVVGWVVTDIGIRFPGEIFQQVKGPLEAHDAMLEAGVMQQMLGIVAGCELVGNFFEKQGRLAGREAGDFFIGKRFLPDDEEGIATMKLKELENGRLAMMAFSGIVTQAALYPEKHFPFF